MLQAISLGTPSSPSERIFFLRINMADMDVDMDVSPSQKKVNIAHERKVQGNEHLKQKNPKKACFEYKIGLSYLKDFVASADGGGENAGMMKFVQQNQPGAKPTKLEQQEGADLYVVLNSNIAQAYLNREDLLKDGKDGRWDEAVKYATAALAVDPTNTKALYRRGKAHFKKNELDEAQADWTKVQEADPALVEKEMRQLQRAYAQFKEKEKAVYKNMFSS